MIASVAQELRPRSRLDAFRSTLVDPMLSDPTVAALARSSTIPRSIDAKLQAGFDEMVAETGAQVGLLHRRGDAFFFTIAVHGLDRGMHMLVWVSMWDPAIQTMLRGQALQGPSEKTLEHGTVARRLAGTILPRYVLAVPIVVGACVEAVLELGRVGTAFGPGADLIALEAMQHVVRS